MAHSKRLVRLYIPLSIYWLTLVGHVQANVSCPPRFQIAAILLNHPKTCLARDGFLGHCLIECVRLGLQAKDPETRQASARALGKLGFLASPAIPDLITTLNDPSREVRSEASSALRHLGHVARPYLLTALAHQEPLVRCGALEALKQYENGTRDIIGAVVKLLLDKDPEVRRKAVQVLGVFRKHETIPDLIKRLEDEENRDVRLEAVVVLGNFRNKAKDACGSLYRDLKRGDGDAQIYAWGLAMVGKDGLAFLVKGLQDQKQSNNHATIAYSIALMGESARDAVPALILCLKTKDEGVLRSVSYALGQIGPGAKQALPFLRSAMQVCDMRVKVCIADSLFRIDQDTNDSIPVLVSAMKDRDLEVRLSAVQVIERMGGHGKRALPALLVTLKDKEDIVRSWSARALGAMGTSAESAIPALERATEDTSATVQDAAREAIQDIKRSKTEK